MAGAEAGPVVAVEVFVEEQAIAPVRSSWNFACPPKTAAARPSSQEDACQPRRISSATWYRFMCRPEPVGHSTVKSSP